MLIAYLNERDDARDVKDLIEKAARRSCWPEICKAPDTAVSSFSMRSMCWAASISS